MRTLRLLFVSLLVTGHWSLVTAFGQSRTVLNNPAVQTDVNMAGHGLTNFGSTGGLAVTVDANGNVTNVTPTDFPTGTLEINHVAIETMLAAIVTPANTTATASQWLRAYNSSTGAFTKSQPAFSDLSGSAAFAQLPTGTTGSTVAIGNHTHAGVYDPAGTAASLISDTAYNASSWDGDTTHSPSKNAVRDKIETLQPLDPDLTAIAALSGTGVIYYRSATNTWSPVTIGPNLSFSGGVLDAVAGSETDPVFASHYTAPGDLVTFNESAAIETVPVGSDDSFLVADSAQPTGLSWKNGAAARTALGLGGAANFNVGTSGTVIPLLSTANTWTAGAKQTFGASATTAGFKLAGVTADPSSPAAGDLWYRSDTPALKYYDSAARTIASLDGTSTLTNKTMSWGSNTFTLTSAQLRTGLSDENGTGAALFDGATSPTFVTPVLGVASGSSLSLTQSNAQTQTNTITGLGTTTLPGLQVTNTTAAAAGAQQYSPSVRWTGQGWKTNATAASQSVEFRSYVAPVQGAANPSGLLTIDSQINGGGFTSNPYQAFTTGGGLRFYNAGGSHYVEMNSTDGFVWNFYQDGAATVAINNAANVNAASFSLVGTTSIRNNSGALAVEKNNTGQWAPVQAGNYDSGTNTVTDGLTIAHKSSSGTPTAGYGEGILFNLNSSTTADQNAMRLRTEWTTATHASRTSKYVLSLVNNAGALADVMSVFADGTATLAAASTAAGGVVTTDGTQTLTNKSIVATQITGTLPVANGGTGDTGTAWTTYSPTITSVTGTITSCTVNKALYKTIGKTVFFRVNIGVTTIGTAGTAIKVPLPVTPGAGGQVVYAEEDSTKVNLNASLDEATATVYLRKYDGSFYGANGYEYRVQGTYESN